MAVDQEVITDVPLEGGGERSTLRVLVEHVSQSLILIAGWGAGDGFNRAKDGLGSVLILPLPAAQPLLTYLAGGPGDREEASHV